MARYVTIKKMSEETGYTPVAIKTKCLRGVWRENEVWLHAPDGRILIDKEGYEKWVNTKALDQFREAQRR